MFKVLKKDNTLEDFKPQKIVEAIMKAAFRCDKQIPDETMFAMANSISERLQSRKKVPVAELHELVIGTLATFWLQGCCDVLCRIPLLQEQLREDLRAAASGC